MITMILAAAYYVLVLPPTCFGDAFSWPQDCDSNEETYQTIEQVEKRLGLIDYEFHGAVHLYKREDIPLKLDWSEKKVKIPAKVDIQRTPKWSID